MKYDVYLVLDTNIVLEGKPLAQLPWNEASPSGNVLVLLMPQLIAEIDKKKQDGRIGPRAREFNRLISPLATTVESIEIQVSGPRVDLALAGSNAIDWMKYDDLDPLSGDHRLIAQILNLRDINFEDVILISHDVGPLIAAKRHGVKTIHATDAWLRPTELSPHDKEVAGLKKKLAELQKTEPEFEIKISLPAGPLSAYRVAPLSDEQAQEHLQRILARNPRQEQDRQALMRTLYDHRYDGRYTEYAEIDLPKFVKQCERQAQLLYNQVEFSVSVKNVGAIRGANVVIQVFAEGGWMNRRPIYASLNGPNAPRVEQFPSPDFANFPQMPQVPYQPGRHEVTVNSPKRNARMSAECQDFVQEQSWEFAGVLCIDPTVAKAAIVIKLTAANLHGPAAKRAEVDLLKVSTTVFELIDARTGKAFIVPRINALIQQAWKAKKYDSVEIDRG